MTSFSEATLTGFRWNRSGTVTTLWAWNWFYAGMWTGDKHWKLFLQPSFVLGKLSSHQICILATSRTYSSTHFKLEASHLNHCLATDPLHLNDADGCQQTAGIYITQSWHWAANSMTVVLSCQATILLFFLCKTFWTRSIFPLANRTAIQDGTQKRSAAFCF